MGKSILNRETSHEQMVPKEEKKRMFRKELGVYIYMPGLGEKSDFVQKRRN